MRKETYRILAKGQMIDNNTWVTGHNNNDVIIGPSGAGKTRGYVKPNIMQCNESMIITDTKGTLKGELEELLKAKGYKIRSVDFTNLAESDGYNPLDFIEYDKENDRFKEEDMITIAASLVSIEDSRDPFWEHAARMLLEGLIAYTMECLPKEEQNLLSVNSLFQKLGTGWMEKLFMELEELNEESFALNRYNLFHSMVAANKMTASIQGILAEKLSPLSFSGTKEMFTKQDRIRFADLGKEKTAVFLSVSDTDRSMDKLVNVFYAQALHQLCQSADKDYPDHRLPIPVRLYLDDFAANTCIPEFDRIISVIRSREISVSIILQSLSQLESMYGHAKSMTILNNCDHLLYLGGQDVETAGYVGIKANRPASMILNMPLGHAWLFARGELPKEVEKYDLKDHEWYGKLKESGMQKGAKEPEM